MGQTHLVSSAAAEPLTLELLDVQRAQSPVSHRARGTTNHPYMQAASSATSPVDIKKRKELVVDRPHCWVKDYEQEIIGDDTKYSTTTRNDDGTVADIIPVNVRYKLYVPAKSNGPVLVEVRFKLTLVFTEEQKEILRSYSETVRKQKLDTINKGIAKRQRLAEEGIKTHWNNKFSLSIDDPLCGKRELPISFKIIWVKNDEHFEMTIRGQLEADETESVEGSIVKVSGQTNGYTYAHEFGHCLGLPDEYSNIGVKSTVRYRKPDGTLDEPIIGQIPGIKEPGDMESLMACETSKVYPRHAWCIAMEASDMLTKTIGRTIKCDILSRP